MKKIGLLLLPLVLILSKCEKDEDSIINLNEPYFTIVDSVFLRFLIDTGVDTNEDGKIDNGEAQAISSLLVNVFIDTHHWNAIIPFEESEREYNISDFTGIEAFTNLETLIFAGADATSIDLSNNNLTRLIGMYGRLQNLDVSNNTNLNFLDVRENELTTLDVSNITALEGLICYGNQLTSLDVSNNTILGDTRLHEMPSLYKVCVWVMPFPPDGIGVDTTGSPNVYFTTDCSN